MAKSIKIEGKFNKAICYTNEVEQFAYEQIKAVCDMDAFKSSKIRIMPDVHAGKGCTIGTTMTISKRVVPGMVGVDIGCGMETVRLAQQKIDFDKLDKCIRENIPCGRDIRDTAHPYAQLVNLEELKCAHSVKVRRAIRSIGTLGGGNHFIEVDKDDDGNLYLVVHTGSRHLGCEVAEYYQEQARKSTWGGARHQIDTTIEKLRKKGKQHLIESTIKDLKKEHDLAIPADLTYCEGKLFDEYIHDMKIVQKFAMLNRKAIVDTIVKEMRLATREQFTTIHNYIDTENMILRKGAVSAQKGEKLLIPINMRDGSLICIGKGNKNWNCSAPHGAGRLMSRNAAFKRLSMDEYKKQMEGIYSTCVARDTLDESPMAYKSIGYIVEQIEPTANIVCQIKPLYNFKSAE